MIPAKSFAVQAGILVTATTALVAARAIGTPVTRQASGIQWTSCPDSDTTQCALFDVPMDYSNPTNGDTVSIFMRKLPANASEDARLGTIITNPGGPGGSGSAFVAGASAQLLRTVTDGKYDIVSFDPRGVNLTSPFPACFETEAKFLQIDIQRAQIGVPYPSASNVQVDREITKRIGAIQSAHNAACLQTGNRKMLESLGTVSVVQDMVKMVEAFGENGLNYVGYSYGTILGATFAALYPELVNRMILDGVSNSESYYKDVLQWGIDGMTDTDKTFTGMLSTCAEAGPEYCAFAVPPNGTNTKQTTESLRKRFDAIVNRLAKEPGVVPDSLIGPGIIKASDIQTSLLTTLYSPSEWRATLEAVVELEKGNYTSLYVALYGLGSVLDNKPYNDNVFNRSMQRYTFQDSLRTIMCSDSAPLNISTNAYADYLRKIGKISVVGQSWGSLMGGCNEWSFRANQRYNRTWTGLKKTKFPILFASNDADPVTPLPAAVKMARNFGKDSATVLVQRGFGHCTINNPSTCTLKYMRDYFMEGKVPANGTECVSDPGYIYPTNSTNQKRAESAFEKRLAENIEEMKREGSWLKPLPFTI